MTRTYAMPGEPPLVLEHLVLDLNGTLTNRGELIDGVGERLASLAADLDVRIATADTYGAAARIAAQLGIPVQTVGNGDDKERLVRSLGAEHTAVIGNGRNDIPMLRAARLGIAVIGAEGAAGSAIAAADVVCVRVIDALDLLLDERALRATMRV
jgi:P-type E1-E2 ATPase